MKNREFLRNLFGRNFVMSGDRFGVFKEHFAHEANGYIIGPSDRLMDAVETLMPTFRGEHDDR